MSEHFVQAKCGITNKGYYAALKKEGKKSVLGHSVGESLGLYTK